MIREPWFWREESLAAKMVGASLYPLGGVYTLAQRLKHRFTKPTPATIPVICIGNATLGGVGKTPFALMLHQLLKEENILASFLTRGYGGAAQGPMLVTPPSHTAIEVGDEALLLAAYGSCIVSRDRPAGAALAEQQGAQLIIMDDGFQNPSLEKTFSFLLVDNHDPFGNGRIFPAGPMREPFADALSRASALVFIVQDENEPIRPELLAKTTDRPVFKAWLEPDTTNLPKRAVAFCGIGRPTRFFESLKRSGVKLEEQIAFPDHHVFTQADIMRLKAKAKAADAPLITTEKDKMRLSPEEGQTILTLPVKMRINDCNHATSTIKQLIRNYPGKDI